MSLTPGEPKTQARIEHIQIHSLKMTFRVCTEVLNHRVADCQNILFLTLASPKQASLYTLQLKFLKTSCPPAVHHNQPWLQPVLPKQYTEWMESLWSSANPFFLKSQPVTPWKPPTSESSLKPSFPPYLWAWFCRGIFRDLKNLMILD